MFLIVFVYVSVCFSGGSLTPESSYGLSAQGSESSVDAESSTAEADQDISEENMYVLLELHNTHTFSIMPSFSFFMI